MSEDTSLMTKPKKIWNDALRMVKGEDSTQLIEAFTSEMTLVAEGLCEDQNKLRGEVNQLMNAEDRRLQQQDSRITELETLMEEREKEHDQIVTEMRNRLAVLEKQAANARSREEKEARSRAQKKERNRIREITILIGVAAAAAIAVILVWKLV